jgi:hypothetical protein
MGIYQRPHRQLNVGDLLQLAPVVLLVLWVAAAWLRSL